MEKEQLDLLPQTGPDTPMGKLLRRFWHPIAVSDRLAKGAARAIRVLGEDLTLYRGESGKAFLVGARCAHRCSVLHTGWIQDDQIRCMYHGWRYDGSGQCTEMPAEKNARPQLVKIAGYAVHEYGGLLFAYMGDAPAPVFDLPRKDVLEGPDVRAFTREQHWDCNWFQQVENSLDAVHVSFVHTWGQVSRFQEEITTAVPELSYEETSAGIRQVATRSKNNVRISDWTFPNNNHIVAPGPKKGDPWVHTSVWAVPIDDHSTMRFAITSVKRTDADTDRRIAEDRHHDFTPVDYHDMLFREHKLPECSPANVIATQDYVALRGQGVIVDRSQERLGSSDAGVAFLRRIFFRELETVRQGRAGKQWKKLDESAHLPISVPETAS
jgi:5,5'-dehydrodivanillate O-demethylase